MEKNELRELIHAALDAMNYEGNKKYLAEIVGEVSPIVFLSGGVSFAVGECADIAALIKISAQKSDGFNLAVKASLLIPDAP